MYYVKLNPCFKTTIRLKIQFTFLYNSHAKDKHLNMYECVEHVFINISKKILKNDDYSFIYVSKKMQL